MTSTNKENTFPWYVVQWTKYPKLTCILGNRSVRGKRGLLLLAVKQGHMENLPTCADKAFSVSKVNKSRNKNLRKLRIKAF